MVMMGVEASNRQIVLALTLSKIVPMACYQNCKGVLLYE
jgi:hypothetical protein